MSAQLIKILWLGTDLIIVFISLNLAYLLRQAFFSPSIQSLDFYRLYIIFAVVSFLISFSIFCLYDEKRFFYLSYIQDFLKASTLWLFLLVSFAFFTKIDFSRLLTVIFFLITMLLVLLMRFTVIFWYQRKHNNREDIETIKIVRDLVMLKGAKEEQLTLIRYLNNLKTAGILYFFMKRILDILVALVGLVVLLPFLPIVLLIIKRDSPGPALVAQKRVGFRGGLFTLYKLRTMKQEVDLYALAPRNHEDERITRVGSFLRKYSIDELPQLWNVLKGDMSLVGPRPEMPFIVEKYEPWQRLRLDVRPGITGLWQIFGRKDLPLHENIEYDLYYFFNQSLFLDLAIIIKTVPHLFFPKGAY